MKKIIFIFFVIFLFSCKSLSDEKPYLGFWEGNKHNYLLLNKNHSFKLYWSVFSKNLIVGIYNVDQNKKTLTLKGKNFNLIWNYRLSNLKLFLFLKDLKNEEFVFYKSNQKYFEEKQRDK